MQPYPTTALLLAALLGLAQCKKKDPDPASGLPAATQDGRNTFGCLVDGQAWTPNGNNGVSNFRLTYDRSTTGGNLLVRAYRYVNSKYQYILIGGSLTGPGVYRINERGSWGIGYSDETKPSACDEYRYTNSGYISTGTLTLTRLDLQAGIIAGTFEAKMVQTGCDTLRITQGRFDYKL